jgi:hypothetical protein
MTVFMWSCSHESPQSLPSDEAQKEDAINIVITTWNHSLSDQNSVKSFVKDNQPQEDTWDATKTSDNTYKVTVKMGNGDTAEWMVNMNEGSMEALNTAAQTLIVKK